jgi:hypothetical protein
VTTVEASCDAAPCGIGCSDPIQIESWLSMFTTFARR